MSTTNDTTEQLPAGPWTVVYDSEVKDVDHGGEYRWVAGIKPVVEYIDFESGVDEEAAAHLMAAAPSLLEALKLHVGKNGHTAGCSQIAASRWPCSKRCQMTRAAIAAAEGAPS